MVHTITKEDVETIHKINIASCVSDEGTKSLKIRIYVIDGKLTCNYSILKNNEFIYSGVDLDDAIALYNHIKE